MSDQPSFFSFPQDCEQYLRKLAKLYEHDRHRDLQLILVNAHPRVDEGITVAGSDMDVYGHALYLTVPEAVFSFGMKETLAIENRIKDDLNKILNLPREFIVQCSLEVAMDPAQDWRKNSGLLITSERSVPKDAETRIWGDEGYFRLFLSHISKFKRETSELKDKLRLFGISCFVAHKDIQPLKEWQDEIEHALASMDALAALLTEGFTESLWTDQEVGFAYARRVPIIPVRLGIDPHGFMSRFQALSTDWKNCPLGIAKLLINEPKMFSAFVRALRVIPNWDAGNLVGEVLPAIHQLNTAQIDDIIKAYNETLELHGSFEFNGTNPRYGKGLVFHLNRLSSSRQFWIDESRLIAEV